MRKFASTLVLGPALALAMSGAAVFAQSSERTGTTGQEMQRGVPGVDVDVGRDAQGRGGVPGVDVDVGRNRDASPDVDTRASGARGDMTLAERRRARADRN
jgi:hypothetical protein